MDPINIPQMLAYIPYIWVKYKISLTWIKAHLGMISLINYDSRVRENSEVVIIYPDTMGIINIPLLPHNPMGIINPINPMAFVNIPLLG